MASNNNSGENEDDAFVVVIEDSCSESSVQMNEENEETGEGLVRPPVDADDDDNGREESKENEMKNDDCLQKKTNSEPESESVGERTNDVSYTTEVVDCTLDSMNIEKTEITVIDLVESQSEEADEVNDDWVVLDEVDEKDNFEKDTSNNCFINSLSNAAKVKIEELKTEEGEDSSPAENLDTEDDQNVNLYYCAACNVQCEDNKAYFMHTRGVMHTLNSGASVKTEPADNSDQNVDKSKGGDGLGDKCEEEGGDNEEESENCRESWLANRAESDAFYCELCECSMNSVQNYETHLIGARHLKNVKNRSIGAPIKKPRGKTAFGNPLAKVVDREPELLVMIERCKEPLIGLQYVTEFCHISPDFEPVYACNLCESKCDVRMIIKHLTGFKHRFAYMKKHYMNYAVLTRHSTRKSDQTAVAETYAAEIEANEGRQKMVVRLETSLTNDSAAADSAESEVLKSPASRSLSPRSDSTAEYREFRKKRHRRSDDIPQRYDYRRRSRSPERQRWRRRRSSESYEQEYYDRRERGHHDFDKHWRDPHEYNRPKRGRYDYDRSEPDYPNSSLDLSPPFQHPVRFPIDHIGPYGMNATQVPTERAYSSNALPYRFAAPPCAIGQFSEYRASLSVTNPAPLMPRGFSNLISYPIPRAPYGRRIGFQPMTPASSMVSPAAEPTATMLPYRISFGARTSTHGVANKIAANRNSLPPARSGLNMLSSMVSSLANNVTDDGDEAIAVSRVIAEAILDYKLQKAHGNSVNAQMPSSRF